jgi:osmotically-inducible protein OsmY
MRRIFVTIALLLLSFTAFAGQLSKSHSLGKFSDAEIEATIKTKLAKSKIGKDGFQVHVRNGIATWTGTTTVMQHKGAATRMAKTAGAIQVVNNIRVSIPPDGAAGNLVGQPRRVEVTTK